MPAAIPVLAAAAASAAFPTGITLAAGLTISSSVIGATAAIASSVVMSDVMAPEAPE